LDEQAVRVDFVPPLRSPRAMRGWNFLMRLSVMWTQEGSI
jgi:hypothetical protein